MFCLSLTQTLILSCLMFISNLFNGHIKQVYIVNGLRGGIPNMLDDVDETTAGKMVDAGTRVKVFYTFSRIHGDLERDYHWLV